MFNLSITPPSFGLPTASNPLPGKNASLPTSNNSPDELSQLLPTKLGNVEFPSVMMRDNASNALVPYVYPDANGARVHNLGNNPREYSIVAVLTNNIYPAKSEQWKAGTLFPTVFNQLIALCDSTSPLQLIHPIFGTRNVQVKGRSYTLAGDLPRDGVFLTIDLIETLIDDNIANTIGAASVSHMTALAKSIDASFATIPSPPGLSLVDLFTRIAAQVKTALAFPSTVIAAVNAQIVQVTSTTQSLASTVYNAPSTITQNATTAIQTATASTISAAIQTDPSIQVVRAIISLNNNPSKSATDFLTRAISTVWSMINYYNTLGSIDVVPLTYQMLLFLAQLQSAKQQSVQLSSPYAPTVSINAYTTASALTFPALARLLNNSVENIISLNPSLTGLLFVPINTSVRYYSE